MKKKTVVSTLILSAISPNVFADDASPPPSIEISNNLHTQVGNNTIIELSEFNSRITTKRSIVNSISGELVPTSSTLISNDELIGGGKAYMQSCYKIEDMMFENVQVAQFIYQNCVNAAYAGVENELTFLMQKYHANDAIFVFSKPIKIKNKIMSDGMKYAS